MVLLNRLTDEGHQVQHVLGGRVVFVDDEARVFLGHLGAADGGAFEAGLLDERSGKVAFRPLERAAGAAVLERLFGLTAFHEVVHLHFDGVRIGLVQLQDDGGDDEVLVHVVAVPVGEACLARGPGTAVAVVVHVVDDHDVVADLSAVGAGVHVDGAADRAGDAEGELQSGKAVFEGEAAHLDDGGARLGFDHVVAGVGDVGEVVSHVEDDALQAFVGDQEVAAAADDQGLYAVGPTGLEQVAQSVDTVGLHQQFDGAADLEGGVFTHGSVFDGGAAVLFRRAENIVKHSSGYLSFLKRAFLFYVGQMGRAEDAGVVAEGGGANAGLPFGVLRVAQFLHLCPQGLDEEVALLRDAAADAEDVGLEDVDEVRDADGKIVDKLFKDGKGTCIALVRCREEDQAVHVGRVALCQLPEQALLFPVLLHGLSGLPDQGRGGGVLLKAAVPAAGTGDAVHFDGHVAYLPRGAVDAGEEFSAEDDAAAHAGAEGDRHKVRDSPAAAGDLFAEGRAVGVVLDESGFAEALLHEVSERSVVEP